MTYHFTAQIPDRGIGILSDSVISVFEKDGQYSKVDNQPKTFIISKYAAISYAGSVELGHATIVNVMNDIDENAVFDDIVPTIQKAYLAAASSLENEEVEFILAARTKRKRSKSKIIKYEMKNNSRGLLRIEDKHHYTAGLELPELENELCGLLTENYKRTFKMEEKMASFLQNASHIIKSPKSFPLGIIFGSLMPLVKEYIIENNLWESVGWPWTILLIPEDGDIHFQPSKMYDGSQSVIPTQIKD